MAWSRKNLLDLADWERRDYLDFIQRVRSLAPRLDSDPKRPLDTLKGKIVANLFFEDSTRTRCSFEIAERMTGAEVLNWTVSGSSTSKGETLRDTVTTLGAMGIDAVVMRHSLTGVHYYVQRRLPRVAVFNAGDGARSHPTQGLLDLCTAWDCRGDLQGATVVILGDVLHSRVVRSDIRAFQGVGARVILCGPRTLMPRDLEALGAEWEPDARTAVAQADVIGLLRIQRERQSQGLIPSIDEYRRLYGATEELLSLAKPGALVMHPAPINRGVEIDSTVADGPSSVILRQVRWGVVVRMALLEICLGGDGR